MILKCPKCNGMMKIDESVIPKTASFKVRCPHCSEIDTVPYPTSPEPTEQSASGETTSAPESHTVQPPREPEAPRTTGDAHESHDLSLPPDAFGRFRFPAEKETEEKPKWQLGKRTRILVWAAFSLAVVVFFALLVNFVLPGPAGQKADLGFVAPGAGAVNGSGQSDKPGQER
jgi:predicted Zn finger-like uncharacterized protein